jgi:hypothetical protein
MDPQNNPAIPPVNPPAADPKPALPPPPPPAATPSTAPHSQPPPDPIKALQEKIAGQDAKIAQLEVAAQERERRAAIAAAAKEHGAKDSEYFSYLADKAARTAGTAFDPLSFGKSLKETRPDLFEPARTATTTSAPPPADATKVAALREELKAAQAARDPFKVLHLQTELQKLGAKP